MSLSDDNFARGTASKMSSMQVRGEWIPSPPQPHYSGSYLQPRDPSFMMVPWTTFLPLFFNVYSSLALKLVTVAFFLTTYTNYANLQLANLNTSTICGVRTPTLYSLRNFHSSKPLCNCSAVDPLSSRNTHEELRLYNDDESNLLPRGRVITRQSGFPPCYTKDTCRFFLQA